MKKFIIVLAALSSFSAFADSASIAIGSFKGKLQIETEKLDVLRVEVEIVNQFCNIWGSTCAGGPRQSQKLFIQTNESNDGKTIVLLHDGFSEMSSSKLGNKFSSCKVNLLIEGVNAEGRNITGSKDLAWVNDKKVCASRDEMTKIVRDSLANTLEVKDGGIWISVK
jgi:hypothetical protein